MTDIAERLRNCENDPMWADHAEIPKRWCKEAADVIERLRMELVVKGVAAFEVYEQDQAEIERLRALLKRHDDLCRKDEAVEINCMWTPELEQLVEDTRRALEPKP